MIRDMAISKRTPYYDQPAKNGHGAYSRWTRTFNGRPYSFTVVTMPDGERRYFVSRYNGYLSSPDGTPREGATKWGCAWSPCHEFIIPATTEKG